MRRAILETVASESSETGPAAQGARVNWHDLPGEVRAGIERICGAPVVEARTQPGGFSPGAAGWLLCCKARHYLLSSNYVL